MGEESTPDEWFELEEQAESALLRALQERDSWDEAVLEVSDALGRPNDEMRDHLLDESYFRPRTIFEFSPRATPSARSGLTVRTVRDHVFLLHLVDEGPIYELLIRSWWTLAEDRASLEEAVRAQWVSRWKENRLPPLGGPMSRLLWRGPDEYRLAFECLDALLGSDDEAWRMFVEQLDEMLEHLETQVADGILLDTLGGSSPPPTHDLDWLATAIRGRDFAGLRRDDAARRSLISYYLKPHSEPISHWRRVIDACPDRERHLHDAVVARIAEHGECRLDFDNGLVGLDAVVRCIQHTFEMASEDAEELRLDAEGVVDDYISGRPLSAWATAPRYPGGHPRISTGEYEGEFYSAWDMGELVESRGEELAHCSTSGVVIEVAFEIERPEDHVEVVWMMGKFEFEWSLPLDAQRHGDAGYWTIGYYNGDAEREIDAAIAVWMPFSDVEARHAAFIEAFPRFWGQFEESGMGAETWRFFISEPALMVDAIVHESSGPDREGWLHRIATFACERASDRAQIDDALWRARGCEPPSDPWWETPSADDAAVRRLDAAVIRQLAAFYTMLSLERVLEPDDSEV